MDTSRQPIGFFGAQGLCAAKQVKPEGPGPFAAFVAPGYSSRQNYQCPCRRAARLVLPVFARSFSADGLLMRSRMDLHSAAFVGVVTNKMSGSRIQ
ncbi:hypothetical protein [Mucilaginibacter sp. UR6-11]|uniref:hypothetical protein n=1 Tax=Mucilaginibacter sp. UR6-11 TaxID=1435644 RepID=UPI001E4C9D20|nr:hypothetical protein [Mucilaginibacter sp. UR6-11]MCC8426730.1 hypothetical protein [Mucilaginibacter sp. UR6-11]